MNRRLRAVASVAVVLATFAVIGNYLSSHPELWPQLRNTPLSLLFELLLLYAATLVALAFVNDSTLRLCKIKGSRTDLFLLTAYTAVINFFGPVQSGPAVRAVYLKKKYNVNLKTYGVATLVYYFFFAAFSGMFLLSALLKWWLLPLAVLGLLAAWGLQRSPWLRPRLAAINLKDWYYLAAATLLQVIILVAIYFLELRSINQGIDAAQAIVYTGAANFALFVSITPGAIGFRESFLVFSQHLHHIGNSTIVAASVIDRGIYVVFLLGLALLVVATHAKRRFRDKSNQV